MIRIDDHIAKSCSSDFISLTEKYFQEDFWWFLGMKTENAKFLTALPQVVLQNTRKYSLRGYCLAPPEWRKRITL